jgi:hypothetical protein
LAGVLKIVAISVTQQSQITLWFSVLNFKVSPPPKKNWIGPMSSLALARGQGPII